MTIYRTIGPQSLDEFEIQPDSTGGPRGRVGKVAVFQRS